MRVERILKGVKTLGPGSRLCIWTNGCNKRCPGCVSRALQEISPSSEMNIIRSIQEFKLLDVDGVTISGGEPFLQPRALRMVVELFNEKNIKDILIYTGYTYEELIEMNNEDISFILKNIAVLIDGEYKEELNDDSICLRGSKNQRIIFIKREFIDRYNKYLSGSREMETYYLKGMKLGVGIPTRQYIKKF